MTPAERRFLEIIRGGEEAQKVMHADMAGVKESIAFYVLGGLIIQKEWAATTFTPTGQPYVLTDKGRKALEEVESQDRKR